MLLLLLPTRGKIPKVIKSKSDSTFFGDETCVPSIDLDQRRTAIKRYIYCNKAVPYLQCLVENSADKRRDKPLGDQLLDSNRD